MSSEFTDMKLIGEPNESHFGEVMKEVCNCLKSFGKEKKGSSQPTR